MKNQPHDTCSYRLSDFEQQPTVNIPQSLQFNPTVPSVTQVINISKVESLFKSPSPTSDYHSSISNDGSSTNRGKTQIAFGTKVPPHRPSSTSLSRVSAPNQSQASKSKSADVFRRKQSESHIFTFSSPPCSAPRSFKSASSSNQYESDFACSDSDNTSSLRERRRKRKNVTSYKGPLASTLLPQVHGNQVAHNVRSGSIESSQATLTTSVNTVMHKSSDQPDCDLSSDRTTDSLLMDDSLNESSVMTSSIKKLNLPQAGKTLESSNFQVGEWSDSLEEEMLQKMMEQTDLMEDEDREHDKMKTDYKSSNLEESFENDTSLLTSTFHPPPLLPQDYDSEMRGNNPYETLTATLRSFGGGDSRDFMGESPEPVLPSERRRRMSPMSKVSSGRSEGSEMDRRCHGMVTKFAMSDPSSSNCSSVRSAEDDQQMLDLMYDPTLNCYFDPKTGKYYELKN